MGALRTTRARQEEAGERRCPKAKSAAAATGGQSSQARGPIIGGTQEDDESVIRGRFDLTAAGRRRRSGKQPP